MSFLLVPDVSYLFLVVGLVLAVLAFFAPGTGFIEGIAILTLILGGYGALSQPINLWAILVLLVGVIPFILAMRKSRRPFYLVISIIALVIGSAYIFKTDVWWRPAVNPILAVVVSVIAGVFLWFVGVKSLEAFSLKPRNKLEDVLASDGEAVTEVTPTGGSVHVAGENWSARSQKVISPKSRVRVLGRQGFVLEVEEIPRFPFTSTPGKEEPSK